ncbi:response regulator transcription factor [Tessaracoccus sp. OS52]|uniref:response regulator transcription factor n=1 Tax=Tessaracoccus sp. OS52 TaxID=2886691 RepID=UPI001D120D15|nr:response regulator transcription factor [Tessaracoccus sp. OS52]MCC2593474.1 response regulator transcription factor [Tessaracoccus sp. OS52]
MSPQREPTRVVVIDDDALVRTGLRMILGGAQGVAVVGEADDGDGAVELVARLEPDVVLMDIRMPRLDGLSATRELLRRWPGLRVLVLTTFDADELVIEALRAGARGFVLKDTAPERLVAAVHEVASGEHAVSPAVLALLVGQVTSGPTDDRAAHARARLGLLTEREAEVARAVARGASNREIGRDLYLSVPTVKSHVSRILTKLALDNRVQIAMLVHDADD